MYNRRTNMPGIVREQRKILPYSITDIGGKAELEVWKSMRLAKEEQWSIDKEIKKQAVVRGMEDGSLAAKPDSVSLITKLYERKAEYERTHLNRQPGVLTEAAWAFTHRPWYVRVYDKCLNFFLNIKF